MHDEKKPTVIRTKDGKEIDLARVRRSLDLRAEFDGCFGRGGDDLTRALLDALEGALNANQCKSCCCMREVHRAAGIVE